MHQKATEALDLPRIVVVVVDPVGVEGQRREAEQEDGVRVEPCVSQASDDSGGDLRSR